MISKINMDEIKNNSAQDKRNLILLKLDLIDYLFFKGDFDETSRIWSDLSLKSIKKYNLQNEYWFYRIRENLSRQKLGYPSKDQEKSEEKKINTDLSQKNIMKIFQYEKKYYEGKSVDFLKEFTKNASIIPRQDDIPLESKIHFLTMGASIILDVEGKPYSALQFAQLASTLAEDLPNKSYWSAWTATIEAKALLLIGDLKDSNLKASNSLNIFKKMQTGDFLGKKTACEVLSQIAELQGNFEEAITYAKYGLQEKYRMETILRLIDLFLQIGNKDEVHKWIYEAKVELINTHKVMSTRLKIRELQLLIAEDGIKLAEQQLKIMLNQKLLDNYLKISCLRLLCDTYNSIKEYEKSKEYGLEAYNLAKIEKNHFETLKSLMLLINVTLQQIATKSTHNEETINKLLDEAFLLAKKSNTRLHLIEINMYDIFHKTLCDKYDFNVENKLKDIKKECEYIGWISGEELAIKLIALIDLIALESVKIKENYDNEDSERISSVEAIEYLAEMKNLTRKVKFKQKI